jgi:hypothetical protein
VAAEEAFVTCFLEHPAYDASRLRVTALDRGRGQEYLPYQRDSRRQIPQRRRVQVFHGHVVVEFGNRNRLVKFSRPFRPEHPRVRL